MFSTIEQALEALRKGEIIIVVDHEDRENEGDFVMAAEKVSAKAINFMSKFGRGIICAPITYQRSKELKLELMVSENSSPKDSNTAFTISVDGKNSTTGVSAFERANTILDLVNPKTKPTDLKKPGHIFPLRAHPDILYGRLGHTEATVYLAGLAGLRPAGVTCEIMNEEGNMATRDELAKMSQYWKMPLISIESLQASLS